MAKPIVKKVPFKTVKATVKGNTYQYALRDFEIQPVSSRPVGHGVQYTYELTSQKDLNAILNELLDRAQDFADKHGDSHATYLGMCDDAGHFVE